MSPTFLSCKRVLIIDDCAPVRAAIKGMLQQIGFQSIAQAKDAPQALTICQRESFDFILCDYNLGECQDGYQLFETLKQQALLHPLCCFIIISAESQRQIVHGVVELQPDDYILKPFSYPVLKERLVRAMRQRLAFRKIYGAIQQQDVNEAIYQCDRLTKTPGEHNLPALRLKGELLLQAGLAEKAQQFYAFLLQHSSQPWMRMGHALALLEQGRWQDNERELIALTQYDETRIEALDWLAKSYFKRQRLEDAYQTLLQAVNFSPKNILRQKTLANLAILNTDLAQAVRIYQRIVMLARYSIHDSAHNSLNQARCIIDFALQQPAIERTNLLCQINKLLDSLQRRFNPETVQFELMILRVRYLNARGDVQEARTLLRQHNCLNNNAYHAESCLDAAKAYFETGDIFGCHFYVDALRVQLERDDLLTESQRLLLSREQQRYEALYQKLKELTREATDAFNEGFFGRAAKLFCQSFEHMPTNPTIALNVLQAASRCNGFSEETLKHSIAALELLKHTELDKVGKVRYQQCLTSLQHLAPELLKLTGRCALAG